MKKITFFTIAIFLVSMLCTTYAGASNYDYGDAPSYGVASHTTDTWQRLGANCDFEAAQKSPDNFDDGVYYSVNASGWQPWGNSVLGVNQGDTVKFKFTVTRANYGKHPYDDLGVWLDLNGDGDWSDSGENIYFKRMDKTESWGSGSGQIPKGFQANKKDETMDFFSNEILIGTSFSGDTWLRARVSCSESINGVQGKFDDNGKFLGNFDKDGNKVSWNYGSHIQATGHLWQGETEDYKMNVSPVPVPAAIWLLGSGLLGLVGVRRRCHS